jgi:hypothetical protein
LKKGGGQARAKALPIEAASFFFAPRQTAVGPQPLLEDFLIDGIGMLYRKFGLNGSKRPRLCFSHRL